ncbi:MAG: VOC family protein [Pseudomonadota bacterium]
MSTREPVSFIATADPDAMGAFYQDVLGLSLRESSPFALVFADGAHTLRVQIVESHAPAPFTAYGWVVTDMSAEIATLAAKGVAFLTFPHFDQDPSGVWATPDGAKIAWFKDPSGNILSLTEFPRAGS